MTIVAANKSYDIYLTSTAPNQLRFRILNADSSFKIKLSMHYFTSNRIDVYKNDSFVDPTNAEYVNGKLTLKDFTQNLNSFMPQYSNVSGTNLAVRADSKVYFAIAGGDYIDLKIAPVLFLKFGVPAITEAAFFNPATLAQNFAALLGIDPSKIRKVNIVRENSKRKKRTNAQTAYVELTIFDNPVTDLNNKDEIKNRNGDLSALSASVINQFLIGELQAKAKSKFNIDLVGLSVQKPDSNGTDAKISKLSKIQVLQNADKCRELSPCEIQPILVALDENGEQVMNIGSDEQPWTLVATIVNSSNPTLTIVYQTEANLDNEGFIKFTNLGVSDVAGSFRIKYEFKTPIGVNASLFNPLTLVSNISINSSSAVLTCKGNEENLIVNENNPFDISISVVDRISFNSIKNIYWKVIL